MKVRRLPKLLFPMLKPLSEKRTDKAEQCGWDFIIEETSAITYLWFRGRSRLRETEQKINTTRCLGLHGKVSKLKLFGYATLADTSLHIVHIYVNVNVYGIPFSRRYHNARISEKENKSMKQGVIQHKACRHTYLCRRSFRTLPSTCGAFADRTIASFVRWDGRSVLKLSLKTSQSFLLPLRIASVAEQINFFFSLKELILLCARLRTHIIFMIIINLARGKIW